MLAGDAGVKFWGRAAEKTRNGKTGGCGQQAGRGGEGRGGEVRGGEGGVLLNDRFSVKHHSSQKKAGGREDIYSPPWLVPVSFISETSAT